MLFGNIGLSLAGPLPIITEKLGDSTLGTKQKIRVWRLFYDAATVSSISPLPLFSGWAELTILPTA